MGDLKNALTDKHSIFHYYQEMIAIRKLTPALVYGQFVAQEVPEELFVY
jgi:hypothetical protein